MKRARTFQRRAKRLSERGRERVRQKGEKITKGVWYFPFQKEADELIEEAKSCGLEEKKDLMLFEINEIMYAPKWLMEKERLHRKEVEETVQKFLNYGKEHQK